MRIIGLKKLSTQGGGNVFYHLDKYTWMRWGFAIYP
jgi:hypothetical protein